MIEEAGKQALLFWSSAEPGSGSNAEACATKNETLSNPYPSKRQSGREN
jgi:hypothetical protein